MMVLVFEGRLLKSRFLTMNEVIQHAAAIMTTPEWEQVFHTWVLEWDKEFVSMRVDRQEILRPEGVEQRRCQKWPT